MNCDLNLPAVCWEDAFVAKLNPTGTGLLYSTYFFMAMGTRLRESGGGRHARRARGCAMIVPNSSDGASPRHGLRSASSRLLLWNG